MKTNYNVTPTIRTAEDIHNMSSLDRWLYTLSLSKEQISQLSAGDIIRRYHLGELSLDKAKKILHMHAVSPTRSEELRRIYTNAIKSIE